MPTRILIIDDESGICRVLRHRLETIGSAFEIEDAADGSLGLSMFKRKAFDLVITDVFMPETEGLEIIGELRRIAPETKIIAMSGGGKTLIGTDILIAAKRIGADWTFDKPIPTEEFLEVVRDLLDLG